MGQARNHRAPICALSETEQRLLGHMSVSQSVSRPFSTGEAREHMNAAAAAAAAAASEAFVGGQDGLQKWLHMLTASTGQSLEGDSS